MFLLAQSSLAAWPIRLEYMPGWMACLLFLGLALPIVALGMFSLNGLGPVRKWVAIGVRLAVLLLFVLILGGIRWQRQHKDLEVMVVRDVSESTSHVHDYPGKTLQASLDEFLQAASDDKHKPADDRIGVISFTNRSLIDAMPGTRLELGAHPIRDSGNGTDPAAALQLALATMRRDAMHRMVLIWDGNKTTGDLDAAIAAAASQHVPIDVIPLRYDVQNAVLMERFVAPTWKRENEPFTLDIILKSTNIAPVTGKLTVLHQDKPMDLDPESPGVQATRVVTLKPGLNPVRVRVPPLDEPGVHQFHATFDAANVTAEVASPDGAKPDQAMLVQGAMDAFTFVQGKGKVLYVDNVPEGRGELLRKALESEEINLKTVGIEGIPNDLMTMQNYDAVVLANVPFGAGGVTAEQDKMLASYVHELGGGLVMIGGDQAFGAGGWQGSEVEKVLPVNMDIPARREVGKGALVLIMHSCEMPDGNYWGEQCGLKAVETLSEFDEIGVISFNNRGGFGGNGSQWDFPLQQKGDGSRVKAAIKSMKLGDMPSFDDSMDLALNGVNNAGGLKHSNAKHKHVIIISDGDPSAPNQGLVADYIANKVSVSTVSVYPHMGDKDGLPPVMKQVATTLKGRAYGPINANPNQLPQIFIKEATVVRRSLIFEDQKGIDLKLVPSTSDVTKGLDTLPPVYGMVLTSRKVNPQIEVPIVAGKNADPLMAHWQTGLGKAVAYTSDAHNKWAANWVGSPMYSKFWAQVVRSVSRPPMSSDLDVQTSLEGDKGKIVVEAMNKESGHLNFLSMQAKVVGPDGVHDVRLLQTGPGTYKADFDTPQPGTYVVMVNSSSANGEAGRQVAGLAMNRSPELRDLRSNESILKDIAERTQGRVLTPWDADGSHLFTRDGLKVTASPLPVWDIVLPLLLLLILIDVATRRIAWDWAATKRLAAMGATKVREFTLSRRVESGATLDALKRVRDEVADQKFKLAPKPVAGDRGGAGVPVPDRSAKFEAKGAAVEGDIAQVVGGATDKPIPPPPKKIEPKGAPAGPGSHTGSLLEAKRRAQQRIKEKEQGGG